ncbi:hypothetical protein [Microcella flavibacter]|uniref:hypothetical protein n=1 Tax=Microcella flavibacter TaxID=1804990 RepID=UPI001457827E|nr:hypothetical protein [Microcella flavibacter]
MSSALLSMSQIAQLARVERPVVTVWRTRSEGSAFPFPAPVDADGGTMRFSADDVVQWLESTGRGNNRSASADLGAHRDVPAQASADSVTALIALRAAVGRPLAGLSRDALLDAADAADPDDDFLFTETEAISAHADLARYVDGLVDASFGESAAMERAVATREGPGTKGLSPAAAAIGAAIVRAVSSRLRVDHADSPPLLVDQSGAAADILVRAAAVAEADDQVALIGHAGSTTEQLATARLARRRLRVHGVHVVPDSRAALHADRPELLVLVLGAPRGRPGLTDQLALLDDAVMRLSPTGTAVVVGPASVLCDGALPREPDGIRAGLLRTGRVRAIVRLPRGLRPTAPRQHLALWVIGAAPTGVELADRWIMTADLSTGLTQPAAEADLSNDLAFALGGLAELRAHAFRFVRPTPTRRLLASTESLVAGSDNGSPLRPIRRTPAELAVRVEELAGALDLPLPHRPVPRSADRAAPVRLSTVGERIAARHLRRLPGTRLGSIVEARAADSGRMPVIGTDEVLDASRLGTRSVDRLRVAAEFPSARFTEPGDVVFITSPRPAALIDREGFAVVLAPARVLRITGEGDAELVPEALVADIGARAASDIEWRAWPLRSVDARQKPALTPVLHAIEAERAEAQQRLARLDDLERTLVDGLARDALQLITPDAPPPTRGTP